MLATVNQYDVGSLVQVSATFKNSAGTLANPSVVTLVYADPTGLKTTIAQSSLTNSSTGVWAYSVDTTAKPGRWLYRFTGTGTVQAAGDSQFIVTDSLIP